MRTAFEFLLAALALCGPAQAQSNEPLLFTGFEDQAERFLEEIRGRIPRFMEGATVEEATLDAWGEKIARFIVALAEEAERNCGTDWGRPSDPPQRP
jgi:hypothetical protein